MQFQTWSTPFGGFGPSGPQVGMPQCGFPQPQVCPPSLNGGSSLAGANSYWSQVMQAQQSLFQGWQQFCGCQSPAPQGGQCQPQQPPQVNVNVTVNHHHYAQPEPAQPAPRPTPRPSTPPRAITVTGRPPSTPTPPRALTVTGRPPATVRPFPKPPAEVAPALPSFPSLPSFGANAGSGNYYGTPSLRPDPSWANQSVEEMFANPFQGQEYLKDALDTITAVRNVYGVQPTRTQGVKGEFRVIAGDRADGVKPREVRIDDANSYDYQKGENSYQENRQEIRFKDGTIGREYDITVTWADDTTTRKRVQFREAGQIIYIRSAEGY